MMNKRDGTFAKKVVAFVTSFAFIAGVAGVSAAFAAITFSGTSLTGDSSFNSLVGATSTTWDLGSGSTLSLQTTNNGPITFGSGLFTVGGNERVGGTLNVTSTFTAQAAATFNAGLSQSGGLVTLASTTITGNATTTGALAVGGALNASSSINQSGAVNSIASTTINGQATTTNLSITALGGTSGCLSVTASGLVATSTCSGVATSSAPTTNALPLWTSATALGNSFITQNTGGTEVNFPLAPLAQTTSSLLNIGVPIVQNGSASGTFIGINTVGTYNGFFLELENNSTTEFQVASSGAFLFAGNGRIGGTLNVTSTLAVQGATTLSAALTQSGGVVSLASTTITGNATTTGALAVGGALNASSSINQSGAVNSIASTTINGSLLINGGTTILKHLSATSSITFAVIASSTCATQTMTVTGANAGDNVYAAPTPVAVGIETQNVSWSTYASSTNTIAIKACNPTTANTASIAAEVWRADVWQH